MILYYIKEHASLKVNCQIRMGWLYWNEGGGGGGGGEGVQSGRRLEVGL